MSKRRTRESRYALRSIGKAQNIVDMGAMNAKQALEKFDVDQVEHIIDEYLKQYKKTSDFIPAKEEQAMNVSKWEDVRAKKNSPEKLKEINERVEHLIEKYEDGFDKRVQDVTSILEDNGHGIYIIGDLAHGKRITTNTRLKVCVYNSGKIVVQGNPEKKDEVVELLQKTYQDMVVRG